MNIFSTKRKHVIKFMALAVCVVFGIQSSYAQVFHINENFSTGSGSTPPSGWSNNIITGNAGFDQWRFNNPAGRTLTTPITSPAAIFDSDNLSSGGGAENVALESPATNTTGYNTVRLKWDQFFAGVYNGTDGIYVEVYNGTSWQTVYSNTTLAYPGGASSQDIDVSTHASNRTGVKVRFRFVGDYSWWWIVDNVQLYTPVTDVQATAVLSPAAVCGAASENVVVRVRNNSPSAISNIPVIALVSGSFGSATLNTTLTRSLASNASDTVIFTTTYNTLAGGTLNVKAYTNLGADVNRANDTINYSVAVSGSPTAPTPTNGSRCGAGSVALSAVSGSAQDSLYWFSSSSSTNQLGSGANFNTPYLNATSTFYVESRRGGIADSLRTTYAAGNGQSGAMFDVIPSQAMRLDSLAFIAQTAGSYAVSVYYRNGTYVGNQLVAANWTLLQTTTMNVVTGENKFVLTGTNKLNMNANQTYGMYVTFGGTLSYTNGSSTYTNGKVTINAGDGISGTFGGIFAGRIWNGTLYFGGGCSSSRTAVTATINPLLQGVSFAKGATYQGNYLSGIISNPDNAKAGSQLQYDINAPTGLTNSDYGTLWTITSTSVLTPYGFAAGTSSFTPPTASTNGRIDVTTAASEIDSTFIVSITARNMANGCDTIINRYYYVAPEPIPGFSSNIGCAGAAVNFTDTSSIVRGTLAYSWNFGDPNSTLDTSNVKNPSYTYSVGGSYTITLRVTSNLGYSTTITKSIEVGYFPNPSFSVVNKCEGDSTSFINKTTLQGPVLAISYLWNFGDSGLSTLQNPKWMYNNIGVYNVTLKATTAFGCSNTFTSNSTVFPIPVADFTAGNACEGSSVGLTNNSTIDFGTMGANWSFGDGNNSNEFSTQHTYATANTYSVKLITYSDFGCSDTVTKQVTVSATPKATFTSVGNCSGDDIVFTNTSTFGGSFTSEWDLGTNSFVQNNATSITKMFQPGTYTVRLKAVSGLCSDIETFVLTVKESPVVGFAVPASACIGTAVQINNTTTGSGSLSYGWSFGDATTSTSMNPSKTYTSAGSYTIHLGVLAANGCADSTSANVVVNALPNAAYSYSKSTVFNSRQVTFTPGSTSFFTYDWDFGDGNGSNQLAPVYTYLSNGPFNAKLTVTDNNGCMNTTTQPVAFSVSSKAITAQTFNFDVYPNPFTSTATINYSLVTGGNLEIKMFDMYGREVAVLFNGKQNAGGYEISFVADQFNLSAGNYMVQLTLNGETASKQIIRVK